MLRDLLQREQALRVAHTTVEALRAGADAVLAATIFHDGHTTVADLKTELASLGVEVRR